MKITKASKRGGGPPPPPDVAAIVDKIAESSNDDDLITILDDIPVWRYPRGDLHVWIPVLNRFDDVLANVISGYELGRLQTNDFTPKTKALLLGVLRVTRLLLENGTSRKIYASYDRLSDLLLTTDIDVLLATILLLLRPSSQYGTAIPVEGQVGSRLANRILTLTRGWEIYQDAGITMLQLASAEVVEPPTSKVALHFYPEEGAKASTTLNLDVSQLETPDQIAEIAEQDHIPVDDQLSLLNKARLLTMTKDLGVRQKLLAIRFLSIATYIFMVPEEVSMSTIFLYETSLVQQLSEVMIPNRGVGDWALSSALYAMDACAHHRQKLSEVLSTIGANVSHGILISLVRDVVHRLTVGGPENGGEELQFEVLDAMMGFIAYVATSPPHSNHIIGGGIIPLLLEMPKTRVERRDNYIPRAMGLLEAMVFTTQQGMTALGNADGVNSLVEIVKAEMDHLLVAEMPEPTYAMSEDTIKFYMTTPIKSTLRVIHRLMQSPGQIEGMRNLVDSDLPKSLKRIFENSAKFGNRVFALAINTMATLVHNEPTSLSILQELQLPQALYEEFEREFPTAYDVLSVIPTAIGAICLNQAGMDFTLAHPRVVEEMVVAAMSSDNHAIQLGQHLDELARHHPGLRPIVLKTTLNELRQACEHGARFKPEEKDRQRYLLDPADTTGEFDKVVENEALTKLLKILPVLQGIMRNSTLAKEFMQAGGLTLLLDTADLPCIPMHLGHGVGGLYAIMLGMLQTLGEQDYNEVAVALLQSVSGAMRKVEDLWKGDHSWDDLGDRLPTLRGLIVRLFNLSNYYNTPLPHGQHRAASLMLKSVLTASNGTFLEDAGLFHRNAMRAVSVFKVREGTDEDTPMDDARGSAAKYLSSRIYTGFTKVFRSFIKLLFHKRTPEAGHRKDALAVSERITGILNGHCDFAKTFDNGPASVVYDTVALGACVHQLFDDRGHEGHLNTILFVVFEKKGGIPRLFALMQRLVATLDEPELQGPAKQRALSGITVALDFLLAFVRPKALIASSQTQILQQRADEKLNPTDLLIKIRREAFPVAKRVWASDALQSGPNKMAHAAVKAFLVIMEGKDEEPQTNTLAAPRPFTGLGLPVLPTVRTPVVADPARVDQLVDMGFPRGAAERALLRARNNVAAAADMILSMPHVFEGAEPAAPAAPSAPTGNETAAPGTEAPATDGTNAAAVSDGATTGAGTDTPQAPTTQDTASASTDVAPAASVPDSGPDSTMDVDQPAAVEEPSEPIEDVKKSLNAMRDEAKPGVPDRALMLLDKREDLLFDLLRAFPTDQPGLGYLLRNLKVEDTTSLAHRMRLFSLLCVQYHVPELSPENASLAYDFIRSLPIDQLPKPSWLTALLLFAETVMVLCTNTKDTAIGDPIERITAVIDIHDRERMVTACQTILADPESKKEELMSAYRCMIILSRLDVKVDFAKCLSPFQRTLDEKLSGCHGPLAMILRHTFEDEATLEEVMRREIRNYLHKDKTTDVKHFVKQLRQVTARDSDTFVNAVEKECALLDPAPISQNYHIRAKEASKALAASDPFQADAVNPTMSMLVSELGSATRATLDDGDKSAGYAGLIFSLLTEVTGSYMSAKKTFMESLRLNGLYGQPKARSGISCIINDLVGCVDIRQDIAPEGQKQDPTKRMTVSCWAMTLLVALCSDLTPTSDIKSVSEDLISIRRTVLDALIKVLKDSSSLEPNLRYGKLWAIGELVYLLLTAKPSITPHQHDDSALQIAKAMVEKNFVGLMTEATGNVDLNYPNIKVALLSLLRALDHLSKVSIKWNKVEKAKGSGAAVDEQSVPSSSSDEESDIDMADIDGDDAPDLYRNSALGILGGEMDEDSEDEDDDDADDDMMELYDDGIDEDDDLGTEPSSDGDMGDEDEVMEDEEEWTDEDEGDDDDHDHDDEDEPQVVIGTEDAEPIWDAPEDEEALLDDEGDHESDMSQGDPGAMDAFQAFLDGVDGMDEEGDEGEEDDELMMDEDEDPEDFLDDIEHVGVEATFHPPSANTGAWGWSNDPTGGRSSRPRSRLLSDQDSMTALFGGGPRPPGPDLTQHPLLVNPASIESRDRLRIPGISATDDGHGSLEERMGPEAARLIETVLHRHRHTGRQDLRIGFTESSDGGIALQIDGRLYTFPPPHRQVANQEQDQAPLDISAQFTPKPSMQRWHDEMVVCGEDSAKLVNHVINRLLPEAKERAREEAEKNKKIEEEAKAAEVKAEESRKQAEAAREKAEDAAREAERLHAEAVAASTALPESRVPTPAQDVEMTDTSAPTEPAPTTEGTAESDAIGGSSQNATAVPDAQPEQSADGDSLARTLISIHGRDVDITGTGIDLEFLQALPDEMRADVVEQHMREHNRHRRPEAPEDPSAAQVSPEFLNALPPDIRNEVLLQQQLESQRRARADRPGAEPAAAIVPPPAGAPPGRSRNTRPELQAIEQMVASLGQQGGAVGAGGGPSFADLLNGESSADFFAGLSNELRDVMMDGSGLLDPLRRGPAITGRTLAKGPEVTSKKPRKDAVQLLDKPGVASLVRLLFFPEAFRRDYLLRVLVNLCENSTTRVDLLNLLLSVVQDGTGDLPAVDKSFAQMSLKPGTTPKSTPRTPRVPDTPAASAGTSALFARLQSDQIPTFIAQRCFQALTHIVGANSQAVTYFLTEHEQPVGLRKPPSKKGKGKDRTTAQTKFPIVVLLDFLDRSLLLKTSGMMESFAALLAAITRPLANLKKPVDKENAQASGSGTQEPAAGEAQNMASTPAVPAPLMATPAGPIAIPRLSEALAEHSTPGATPAQTPGASGKVSGTASHAPAGLTTPPQIPPPTLRLVVNCLTLGECTSRTFGYTLAIIQNLSVVPEAKQTILDELQARAQRLGQTIFEELVELKKTLDSSVDALDAASLITFSPPSSSQAQLLRLLKTIDYIHTEKVDSDPPGETMTESEKAIGKAFETFDFEPMWKQLSECLTVVDEKGRTDQISTVLLPLVEALMVICKYRRPEVSRETRSPSEPPTSAVDSDNLFVSFTTTHRKVLNAIVRTNPGLLSGSFSLLVRNPRVLEFDNKRNWFLQKLKRKRDQPAHSPVLHLNIRRQYVFEDSFRALERRTGEEVKYGKLSVKFYNEDGIDAGGVTREWFSVLAQQIFDPNFALFEPCAADAQTYQPNKASSVNGDHLSYFKFVGRVIGKAVFDGRLLDAYFSRAFYKQILGKTVDMRDLESIDPEYHKSLQWMLDNDITDVIDQEFTIEDDQFGEKKVVELKEGGAQIPVTEENKAEYVRLVVSYRIENSIKDQIKAFLNGFYEIIPRNLIQIFEADQLELLISGITSIDVDELKNATQMAGWKGSDPEIAWFWRALRSFSQEERARFLMFVTSSSRVPLGGFTQLQGASGIQPFQIQKLYSKEGSLPQASTCFNLLLLPKYESYEQLRERLQFAVYETGGFGKA